MATTELLDQIRSARITASPELRTRMRELTAAVPPAPPRRELPWRRWTLVLVPASVVVALAGALAVGLATSGKSGSQATERQAVQHGEAATPLRVFSTAQAPADSATTLKAAGGAGGTSLPSTPGRAQLYDSELTLKVKDLSTATKRALRLARTFGGYVRSVEYGSGTARGTAYIVLRVPVGSIQAAIVRFTALGAILDQHVSIRDVQPQLDRRFRAMQARRDEIAKLQARLESPTLSASDRQALENELVVARRQLVILQLAQARQQRQTSYGTVSLDLRTAGKAVAVPHHQGRLGRALDRSGAILLDEAKVALYVLIVGAPLFVLLGLGLGGARVRRRRTEARLLAS